MKSIFKEDFKNYIYVSNLDMNITSKITLFSNGDFVYKASNPYCLCELCQNDKGRWFQKKDTVFLTTFFQGDYFAELEDAVSNDSVLICFYSIQTGEPSDDFAYFNENDSLEFPTINGYLYISCAEKEILTGQLRVGYTDDEIRKEGMSLECGRAYRYYIKDCLPTVMREDKFIITDSCLVEISTGSIYRLENVSKLQTIN